MWFHDCTVTRSWVWHSLTDDVEVSSFHKSPMAPIAQPHLLSILLCQSKGRLSWKATFKTCLCIFSKLKMQLRTLGGQGTTGHRRPYMCAMRRFKDCLTKKKVFGKSKFHFFNVTPRFSPRKNYCFVFCNLKAAISTFLRYSRRPKHVWKENKYMKRNWLVYFQCAEYIRLLFILWVDVTTIQVFSVWLRVGYRFLWSY